VDRRVVRTLAARVRDGDVGVQGPREVEARDEDEQKHWKGERELDEGGSPVVSGEARNPDHWPSPTKTALPLTVIGLTVNARLTRYVLSSDIL